MAIKIKLRKKKITKGRLSLYLDFYPPIKKENSNTLTRREFLGIYITEKPKNPLEKQDNKQTLHLAEQIRQKRDNELNKPEIYSEYEKDLLRKKEKGALSFLDYFKEQMEKREGKNYEVWNSSLYYLNEFSNNNLTFSQIDEKWCDNYKHFLLSAKSRRSKGKKISQNTALSYFNKFKATLKQAFKDDMIPTDINSKIGTIKTKDTHRTFLTIEELNILANTHCPNQLLKNASLFASLTGLRFSDIAKLKWSEIHYTKDSGYSIQFQQQKTKQNEYQPISYQAYELLGEPSENNENLVFNGLAYSAYLNKTLKKWVTEAGIKKNITFHSFRHTYATLQLQNGTDIYTVSKMLGHRELKTTQIYAKIIDETKLKTTDKIKLDI